MINTIEIQSRRDESKMNTLFLDESGKAVGCTCSEAQAVHNAKYNFKPCHCMKQWNTEQEFKAQAQALEDSAERYKQDKAQREAEQYEKRIAYLASQKQARKDEERSRYNYYEMSLGII